MKGVILAAGRGSRIFPLTKFYPKPILPILNKPIIEYQIEAMNSVGITDIFIVVGYLGDMICDYFGSGRKFGVKLRYVFDSKPEGIASSLLKVKNLIDEPFVLFLGDIFVEKLNLQPALLQFIKKKAEGVIVARREATSEPIKRNFEVIIERDSSVLKVIEKPKRPKSLIKGCGIYVFSPAIFSAIEHTGKTALRGEYEITDSVQTLIDEVGNVYCQLWDTWDFNLSYPRDLLDCNLRILKEKGLENLIGKNTKINPGAKIHRSVIGDRAVVLNPISLDQCLVFADTTVYRLKGAKNTIFEGRTNLVL